MKIVNVESKGYSRAAKEILETVGEVVEANADYDELLRLAEDADVLIVRLRHRIDETLFRAAPGLKAIVTATTGLDHVDLEQAASHGVEVLSLRGETDFLAGITATAELTWGLVLSLVRRIPEAHRDVLSGRWDRDAFRGRDLKGKILGIVGYGRLGKIVAEYGRAFRMKVVVSDPYLTSVPEWVEVLPFDSLLSFSDIVTVHVDLNPDTVDLFGGREFGRMKSGSFFVNTSRGALVDEDALLAVLNTGHLGGAALDVLRDENRLQGGAGDHPLCRYARDHGNLILTPHIGGVSKESIENTEVFMARKLKDFLEKGNP